LIYHLDLTIAESSPEECIRDCHALSSAAQLIDVQSLTGKAIEPHLLRLGHCFHEGIAQEPLQWANFAYNIHAEEIFKDAIVHLVGSWKAILEDRRSRLQDEVRALVEAKVGLLDYNKQGIEMRMIGNFPQVLHRAKTSGRLGRSDYSNHIWWWIASALFLQWSTQSVLAKVNYEASDGGATFYRQIAAGGSAYLDRAALDHFHQFFPMTGSGAGVLESTVENFKDELKDFVAPLMVNTTKYDAAVSGELPYLTCAVIEKGDLPWYDGEKYQTIVLGERKRPREAEEVDDLEAPPRKRPAPGSHAQAAREEETGLFFKG
jgi:hypothetical protein